jgi:transcriptional regulator GlxA family with amidase domain
MIHVSILVPSASAVLESVVSVFTILDQANDHALARGGDAIFDIHLVGTTDRVDLYGGHCSVTPDLQLAETPSTGLVIVPSLAGNIAEGLRLNAAFIPWMRAQYHAGAEVAGLCTAALFIADTGLVGDARCSPHWFVDAAFRKEFSYIGLIVDRTAPDERAISGTGAYSFFHRVLERAGGREVASLCAASSEAAFNQQCQSVLTVADEVARVARHAVASERPSSKTAPRMTMGAFTSMFEANRRGRSGSGGLDAVTPASPTRANGSTLRRLIRRVPGQARLGRRSP